MRMEHASMNGGMHIHIQSLWLEEYDAKNRIDPNAKMDASLGPREALSFPLHIQPHT